MPLLLFLCRHAHALSGSTDHERELSRVGEQQAAETGRWLAQRPERPQVLCSSSATRARSTAGIIAEELGQQVQSIRIIAQVYEAPVRQLLHVVNAMPGQEPVLLVGHNPGISGLADYLTGNWSAGMDTAEVRVLQLEAGSWAEAAGGTATEVAVFVPEA